jgi:hypothetical protein
MGHPSKLTDERKKIILDLVRRGQTLYVASMKAGIVYETLRTWVQKAKNGGPYAAFAVELAQAEADAEEVLVDGILEAGKKDWRAKAWILERRHPERWAKTDFIKGKMDHAGTLKIVFEEVGGRDGQAQGQKDSDVLEVPDGQS